MIAERNSETAEKMATQDEESTETGADLFEGMNFPSVPTSKVVLQSSDENVFDSHADSSSETRVEDRNAKSVASVAIVEPASDDIISDLLGTNSSRKPRSSLSSLYPVPREPDTSSLYPPIPKFVRTPDIGYKKPTSIQMGQVGQSQPQSQPLQPAQHISIPAVDSGSTLSSLAATAPPADWDDTMADNSTHSIAAADEHSSLLGRAMAPSGGDRAAVGAGRRAGPTAAAVSGGLRPPQWATRAFSAAPLQQQQHEQQQQTRISNISASPLHNQGLVIGSSNIQSHETGTSPVEGSVVQQAAPARAAAYQPQRMDPAADTSHEALVGDLMTENERLTQELQAMRQQLAVYQPQLLHATPVNQITSETNLQQNHPAQVHQLHRYDEPRQQQQRVLPPLASQQAPTHPPGPGLKYLSCGRCHTWLQAPREALNVACYQCHAVNMCPPPTSASQTDSNTEMRAMQIQGAQNPNGPGFLSMIQNCLGIA